MKWQQDHIAFQVADLDAAIQFYVDRLGLALMFKEIDLEHHEAFAFLELEGGNLELLQLLDEENRPILRQGVETPCLAPPYCPHLALEAPDLDAWVAQLEQADIPLVKGPLEIPGKVKWLYIADPDGNIIEFVQWL